MNPLYPYFVAFPGPCGQNILGHIGTYTHIVITMGHVCECAHREVSIHLFASLIT